MACDPEKITCGESEAYLRKYVDLEEDVGVYDETSHMVRRFQIDDDDDDDGRFDSVDEGEGTEVGSTDFKHILDETFDSEPCAGGGMDHNQKRALGPTSRRRRWKMALIALLIAAVICAAGVGIAKRLRRRNRNRSSSDNNGNEAQQQDRSLPTENPTSQTTPAPSTAASESITSTPTEITATDTPQTEPTPSPSERLSSPSTAAPSEPESTSTPTETQTAQPTTAPSPKPTVFPTLPGVRITVGVYYYPWYGDNNFRTFEDYLRDGINQAPTLGSYNDRDPAIIARHLEWSRKANINLWVTSYRGEGSLEDQTIQGSILPHEDLRNMKIALLYESLERIRPSENYATDRVEGDVRYICENYFRHSNYYHIDGRPVVVLYLTRVLEEQEKLAEVISIFRSIDGCDPYLIGDHAYRVAPDIDNPSVGLQQLDAITNYDVYGSMVEGSIYAGREAVEEYYIEQGNWKLNAILNGIGFIPGATPGFNNRAFRPEANLPPLARKLGPNESSGSLFDFSLRLARGLVETDTDNLLLVNSWNKWREDTQIEPAFGDTTSTPRDLTSGIEYEGYGELYLDILYTTTIDRLDR